MKKEERRAEKKARKSTEKAEKREQRALRKQERLVRRGARRTERKAKRAETREVRRNWKNMNTADRALFLQKRDTLALDLIKITAGSFLVAFCASVFMDPMGLVNGGVIGIAIVLKELLLRNFGIVLPLAVTNLVLNLPLLIAGIWVKGWKYMAKTVLSTLELSLFLELTSFIRIPVTDYFLMAGAGGIICGLGIGLVVSGNATTGGSDLLAALIQNKFKHLSVPNLLGVVDVAIVFLGLLVFDWTHSLYAIFTILITSYVGDLLISGMVHSKAVYVISRKWEQISQRVMKEMSRGMTGLDSRGMFSGEQRTTLFCVVSVREVVGLKRLIYDVDPGAFVIVMDAQEVVGEGFKDYGRNGE